MTNNPAQQDLRTLVENIPNAQNKPYLEPTLRSSLLALGHESQAIDEALNQLFKARTLQ